MPREHGIQKETTCVMSTLEMLLNVPTGQATVEKQNRLMYVDCYILRSGKNGLQSAYILQYKPQP